ncbi:MAG TPA: ERF family protein [Pirellulaceae bacterium]|jgi:hypothetical protein|nr:ERF family protein [Pirellulaceae bacterium]
MSIYEKLVAIQSDLKAPKGQTNSFGGYKYRSCEDILEAVKPLLKAQGLVLCIGDDIVEVGGRVYVRATAMLRDGETSIEVSAFARESETKKGMDESQITGAASSYARKYALNGLFCIDDTKDADTRDNTAEKPAAKPEPATPEQIKLLTDLIDSTKSDRKKLYEHFKVSGAPSKAQASDMIDGLKKKLDAQINAAA